MCLRNDQLMVGSTLKISSEPATVKSLLRAVNHAEDEHLVYGEPGRALLGASGQTFTVSDLFLSLQLEYS